MTLFEKLATTDEKGELLIALATRAVLLQDKNSYLPV